MAVWEQGKRKARWNTDKTELIDGGGQWNGNIPIPMFRNLAAELTLGLENTDIRIAAFGEELLDGLPATVYPFDVDVSMAKKGEALYAENCAACHQPHNGMVYSNLGTNLDRSGVVNKLIAYAARKGFTSVCSPTTSVVLVNEEVQPCAEFEGVSLKGRSDVAMSPPKQHDGYNALPLDGIWAQAPYLHNGSVPTLYHLLVPGERPTSFIKGRLDYDKEFLGYSWDPNIPSSTGNEEGYLFDTSAFPAINNAGHDTLVQEDNRTYKLDWSDDKEGAKAIIEYMKTL